MQSQSLPRLRRLISRGRRRGRDQFRAYNYKTDCAGAQKLFYIGFVLSSIASIAFLISFVFNSASSDNSVTDGSRSNSTTLTVQRSRRRQLGVFETLALLCSAFGLCLIAGVFLCGLYVSRRRKGADEVRLIVKSRGGCWDDVDDGDCEDDGTCATEASGGELSSYSVASAAAAAGGPVQTGGLCNKCGFLRADGREAPGAGPDADFDDLDDELDDEDSDEPSATRRRSSDVENGSQQQAAPSAAPAEQLIRRALNSGVPRRLRRCTCGQISTVSRLSDQRAEAGGGAAGLSCGAAARQGLFEAADEAIGFF